MACWSRIISDTIVAFVERWSTGEQAERTNAQPFLLDLCDLLDVTKPPAAIGGNGAYRFERSVKHYDAHKRETTRRIDLYKSGCFILEAKQGANVVPKQDLFSFEAEASRRQVVRNSPGWVQHMLQAKNQAEGYVRDLPPDRVSPPFLIVCDVGFCFDVYSDFSGTGRHYVQFPDRAGFRIYLADLLRPEIRAQLVAIWQAPHSIDPARRRTEVTNIVA